MVSRVEPERCHRAWDALLAVAVLLAPGVSAGAQGALDGHSNPPWSRTAAGGTSTTPAGPQPLLGSEQIGPWSIVQAPSSATLVSGGGGNWDWLNVVNAPITLEQAFTGFSLIDDGFANGPLGTTVELGFSPAVVNHAGPDLVLLDARFSRNSYAVSTRFDGFAAEVELPISVFGVTGEARRYYYGGALVPFAVSILAAPVDLSDLGVPPGGMVSAVRVIIRSAGGDFLGLGRLGPVCPTLDFATEDDFATPLVNGQHIDAEFGLLVSLSSAGANAGLAIFDSTPGGPNDPSQDRDLLVGTGNLLILQTENQPPDGNDVFPRPNDDDDGGTIAFAFAVPVEAASLRLVDVDAGDGASTVRLIDGDGRARTYTVPSNWTGDLLLGQPGHGVLDLATLLPQPGFGSVATASETPGFEPGAVVRIEVVLGGSGGIDDLALCFPDLPLAGLTVRNGGGANAACLSSNAVPVLGSPWSAVLDCAGYGPGPATLVGRRRAIPGTPGPFGELLIGGGLLFRETRVLAGAPTTFTWDVPDAIALVGLEVHVQGECRTLPSPGGKVGRADGQLSNALDLVLGF